PRAPAAKGPARMPHAATGSTAPRGTHVARPKIGREGGDYNLARWPGTRRMALHLRGRRGEAHVVIGTPDSFVLWIPIANVHQVAPVPRPRRRAPTYRANRRGALSGLPTRSPPCHPSGIHNTCPTYSTFGSARRFAAAMRIGSTPHIRPIRPSVSPD